MSDRKQKDANEEILLPPIDELSRPTIELGDRAIKCRTCGKVSAAQPEAKIVKPLPNLSIKPCPECGEYK